MVRSTVRSQNTAFEVKFYSASDVVRKYMKNGRFDREAFLKDKDVRYAMSHSSMDIVHDVMGKTNSPGKVLYFLVLRKLAWMASSQNQDAWDRWAAKGKNYADRMLNVASSFEIRIKDYLEKLNSNQIHTFDNALEYASASVDFLYKYLNLRNTRDPYLKFLATPRGRNLLKIVYLAQHYGELFRSKGRGFQTMDYILKNMGAEFLMIMPATHDALISMGGTGITFYSVLNLKGEKGSSNVVYEDLVRRGLLKPPKGMYFPESVLTAGGAGYVMATTLVYFKYLTNLKYVKNKAAVRNLLEMAAAGHEGAMKDLILYLTLSNYASTVARVEFDNYVGRVYAKRCKSCGGKFDQYLRDRASGKLGEVSPERRTWLSRFVNYSKAISNALVAIEARYKSYPGGVSLLGGKVYEGKIPEFPVTYKETFSSVFRMYLKGHRAKEPTVSKTAQKKAASEKVESNRRFFEEHGMGNVYDYLISNKYLAPKTRKKVLDFLVKLLKVKDEKGEKAAKELLDGWLKETMGVYVTKSGKSTYVAGSKSSARYLQILLNIHRLASGKKLIVEDGVIGTKTKGAIRDLQKEVGLKVDGKFGYQTAMYLFSSILGNSHKQAEVSMPSTTQRTSRQVSSTRAPVITDKQAKIVDEVVSVIHHFANKGGKFSSLDIHKYLMENYGEKSLKQMYGLVMAFLRESSLRKGGVQREYSSDGTVFVVTSVDKLNKSLAGLVGELETGSDSSFARVARRRLKLMGSVPVRVAKPVKVASNKKSKKSSGSARSKPAAKSKGSARTKKPATKSKHNKSRDTASKKPKNKEKISEAKDKKNEGPVIGDNLDF